MKNWLLFILMLSMTIANTKLVAQNDTLVMSTNEFLVGEIKEYDEGVITIETDYSDSDIKAEWKKVKYIHTKQNFFMLTAAGNRYFGTLASEDSDSSVVIVDNPNKGKDTLSIHDILFLKKIEETFWSRLSLSLSVGFTLAKANNNNQFSGNFNTGYLSSKFKSDLSFSILKSRQTIDDVNTRTSRTEAGLGVFYFIFKDWFSITRVDLLQSSEQLLKLRSTTKGGIGNYILKKNSMNLGIAGGIAWNYENYESYEGTMPDNRNSAEAFFALEYIIFDLGDLDFSANCAAYPSLTEKRRFRSDLSFDVKYEFFDDFFVKLKYTLNYDNQPVAGASPSDYVLQTTLGWEL